jgi:amino acid adenylation domain-containing protein
MHRLENGVVQAVQSRIVEQANSATADVALLDSNGSLSWDELGEQAQRLASAIRSGTDTESRYPVIVQCRRSRTFVVASLAARLAGCTYIPLDDSTPEYRRQLIATDAGANLLITDLALSEPWHAIGGSQQIVVAKAGYSDEAPTISKDVAYIVYTSGSTGTPKGCLVRDGGMYDTFQAISRELELTAEDRWSCVHSFSFDVSVFEVWAPLLVGASVWIISDDARRDPELLLEELHESRATVISLTPSLLSLLIAEVCDTSPVLTDVNHLLLAGEPIRLNDVQLLLQSGVMPNVRVWNLWGISEGTVHCTLREITVDTLTHDWNGGTPIGQPLDHLTIELVDSEGLSEGCERGEIVVTGSSIACGYLRRPELTKEAFSFDPSIDAFSYRSGDWAEYFDGELVYLGRRDNQVKIRGHRVELGEVEAAIVDIETVRAAACMGLRLPGREDIAVACLVQSPDPSLDAIEIRKTLHSELPTYMIPERVQMTEALPLTSSGKVDRSAVAALLHHSVDEVIDV